MNRQPPCYQVVGAILTALLLAGCGAPAATPALLPPTGIPTQVPSPTIPPTPEPPPLVTDVELLFGDWEPLSTLSDAMFLQINADGTCRQAWTLDQLLNDPKAECTYTFENSILSMTVTRLNGLPECPSPTGSYKVSRIADDQIQLVSSPDRCAPRRKSTEGSYQRIP